MRKRDDFLQFQQQRPFQRFTHAHLEEADLMLERRLYLFRKLLGDHHVAAGAHGSLSKQVFLG